jgi:hypothetical protein
MYDVLGWLFQFCCYVVETVARMLGQNESEDQYWKSSELGQQRQREREEAQEARKEKTE